MRTTCVTQLTVAFASGPNEFDLTAPEVTKHVEREETVDTQVRARRGQRQPPWENGLGFLGDFLKACFKG